eukprot:12907237-Ditylum_brightwellii.AAC.1
MSRTPKFAQRIYGALSHALSMHAQPWRQPGGRQPISVGRWRAREVKTHTCELLVNHRARTKARRPSGT